MSKDSSFYCAAKGCRKTAWDTPEYLTPEDWALLEGVVELLKKKDGQAAFDLLWESEHIETFFDRVLGWPEGHSYCRNNRYWLETAMPGILKHKLPKMEKALFERVAA